MKCFTCGTEMKCVDDVNEISTRIDFVECPKCKSKADIVYENNNCEYIKEVNWKRD